MTTVHLTALLRQSAFKNTTKAGTSSSEYWGTLFCGTLSGAQRATAWTQVHKVFRNHGKRDLVSNTDGEKSVLQLKGFPSCTFLHWTSAPLGYAGLRSVLKIKGVEQCGLNTFTKPHRSWKKYFNVPVLLAVCVPRFSAVDHHVLMRRPLSPWQSTVRDEREVLKVGKSESAYASFPPLSGNRCV